VEPQYMMKLTRLIIQERIKARWMGYLRVDSRYTLDDLLLMRRAGCFSVTVGVESLDSRVLKAINKGYTAAEAVSFLKKLFHSGIEMQANMIVNLPGTTYRSALKQHKIMKELFESEAKRGIVYGVAARPLDISRNAPMGIRPEKYGIEIAIGAGKRVGEYLNCLPHIDLKGMTAEEIASILGLYDKLNNSMESNGFKSADTKTVLCGSDVIKFNHSSAYLQDSLFANAKVNGLHSRLPSPSLRLCNLEDGGHLTLSNKGLVEDVVRRLPLRFRDLKDVYVGGQWTGVDEAVLKRLIEVLAIFGIIEIDSHDK